MARLVFDMVNVQELIEHARTSPSQAPSSEMYFDPAYWKEGAKANKFGVVDVDAVDLAKVPPHLKLVKEDAIYLMSSGRPGLPSHEGGAKSRVVHAYRHGPGMAHTLDHAVGAGDFSIPVFLTDLADHVRLGPELLAIDIDERGYRIERPSFPINSDQMREAKGRAGDTSMKHEEAQPRKAYIGRICGSDNHHLFQMHGRKMIVHDRDLLGASAASCMPTRPSPTNPARSRRRPSRI